MRRAPVVVRVRPGLTGYLLPAPETAPAPRSTSFRTLGRNTAIYGFGVVLGRAVSFIMLPVYTRFLSQAEGPTHRTW